MNNRAPLSRLLAPLCAGASLISLLFAACSVPEFEFPPSDAPGAAGAESVGSADPCKNKQLDADSGESDFDCGGACGPCSAGQHCNDSADCDADLLCHDGTCIGLGCMNEAVDGNETDVDCGGDSCKACGTGQICGAGTDCESGVCTDEACAAPACDDRVTNGKETGLDCGGDCSPCAPDEPCVVAKDCISGECNDKVCGAECQDGFANCDKKNDNACEINTRTDLKNCGFCGNVCDLPNAAAECSAGECHIKTDGCKPGFQDCNGDPADGCEVDLKTNKLNCGACNKVCPDVNGDPSCVAGSCQITCTDGYIDCDDNRDNGCEINTKLSSRNCGACDKVCPADPGNSAYCKDSTCGQTTCAAGKGDCNGDPADACETNTTNDIANCGGCGIQCAAVNANVACVNSQCVITSCQGTFADCDKATPNGFKNGCEVDTSVDTGNCGGCGKACSIANGAPRCVASSCEVGSCSGTFRDCDGDPKTGCEINVATNTKNCGGCGAMGSDCGTKYANATSTCVGGGCLPPTCNAGFGDCSGGYGDGCETNTTLDPAHCGSCATVCLTSGAHVSSNACVNSQCDPKCSGAYLSCDGIKPNGCEADSTTDEGNCGACGTICSNGSTAHVVSNDCLGSSCTPVCTGTYGDCDGNKPNGCEVDTATSYSNCGGCGKACTALPNATATTCTAGTCKPQCKSLFGDCDGQPSNGCEADFSVDKKNCSACGFVCGTQNATATSCGAGKCSPTCSPNFASCKNPELGCTTQLGTTTDCTKCGEACASPTVFCDPAGCVDHRDIVVVNSGKGTANVANQFHNVAGWGGGANVAIEMKLTHTLQTAKGNNRMILVGVTATDTLLADPPTVSVTYATKPMQLAVQQLDSAKQSYAAVFYILDSSLPDAPGMNDAVATYNTPGNRWGHTGIDLMELRNTMQVAPIATVGAPGNTGCSTTITRSGTLNFNQAGSLVYGVFGARGGTSATLNTTTGFVETWNQYQNTPGTLMAAAAYLLNASTNTTVTWTGANCYNSSIAMVAIKRLNWN